MKPVLIIRTGRAPDSIRARHGDFPHWFRLAAGLLPERLHIVDVAAGESLPAANGVAGAIVTGSAAMVTEKLPWSEATAGWIRDAMDAELPLFGVCYGHQLMTHALGGRVDYLPGGREIGTQSIELAAGQTSDRLADGLPARFRAHTTHEQSVLEPPAGARILASSARDPHQWLRYGPKAISVQFHPEVNADVMRAYIRRKRHDLHREGADPARIFNDVGATPIARRLLRRFARLHGWTND
ncbi:glutamine amidotransferase [Rhodanobacter lindaniclasticus]|uniref:GMP synthase n=1 Tax=Rhodanobacter lindaniclasticus TaxID=75310 RepID=A0A4S3KK40_9GAMM|nr:glutamine amidotransferase [Rhodanobacter lindaniclasticus]THD09182.1 GMP synthase [Rhodanobacter lindaniclasticus]